jgi:hypothetical protein
LQKHLNIKYMNSITIVISLITFLSGMLSGALIYKATSPKCNHKWRLIKSGNLTMNGVLNVGHSKIYECERCLKMKKEVIYYE